MYKITIIILFLNVLSCIQFSGHTQNIDIDLLHNIQSNSSSFGRNTSKFISKSTYAVCIATPLVMGTVSLIEKDDELLKNTIYVGASLAVTTLLTFSVKYSVDRTRPYDQYPGLIYPYDRESSPSFPSGHTSVAFSLATSLSIKYPKWYVIAPCYLWAGSVGYSRMNLGSHYPSDVLVGAVLGSGSAFLTHKINGWFWNKRHNKKIFSDTYTFL